MPRISWTACTLLAGGFVVASVCMPVDVSVAAPKVGVASAVRNDVEGIQGGSGRSLSTGSTIFEQEIIRTGAESIAQLLFLDQTTLSVGPRSEVTLDRFVFDPNRATGDVLLSATKGAFRFISGSQNPLSYKISTPSATIGVRGTIVDCAVGSLTCVVQEGSAIIEVGDVSYTLNAGDALTIDDNGVVTGPYQHDGVFDAIKFATPWPLYGGALPGETWQFDVPDDSTIRLDDIFEPELVDPPYNPCQEYYECEEYYQVTQ